MPFLARIGLQKRIMLYVAIGLVAMFSLFVYLGVQAMQRSTDLVFGERLAAGYNVAAAIDQSFSHIIADALEEIPLEPEGLTVPILDKLYHHLSATEQFLFFEVTDIWVVDADGNILLSKPPLEEATGSITLSADLKGVFETGEQAALKPIVKSSKGQPFASIALPLGDGERGIAETLVINTIWVAGESVLNLYLPGLTPNETVSFPAGALGSSYHLEVMHSDGTVIIGHGPDEIPGTPSWHFPLIQHLIQEGKAEVMLHKADPGSQAKDHIMAVVPLKMGPFYLVLEQDEDIALALPNELRRQLLLFGGLGFLVALALAWVTTRGVVKPAESLTAAARKIAEGELKTPIDVKAQDEIGTLAESLEAMRQRLKTALEEIERSKRELEERVQERTAELSLRMEERAYLLEKLISAQEDERKRIARELHDETAQGLSALSIELDRIRDLMALSPKEALQRTLQAKALTSQLLDETRRLILDLRPSALDDLGLTAAIRWYAQSHLEDSGVDVKLEGNIGERLPSQVEVSLFRIVQEAINNIAKHAQARNVSITLSSENSLVTVSIRDDGKGFNAEEALARRSGESGAGLLGMQERASLLGGKITITSQPGKGAQVEVQVPVA